MFRGQLDPQHQIHDLNPGIDQHGVFWTTRIPDHAVTVVDFDRGRAAYRLHNFAIEDYHDLLNALADGPSVPATLSFEVRWRGVQDRVELVDQTNRFRGTFLVSTASAHWTAREKGVRLHSSPALASVSEVAILARERNGVFF